MSARPYTLRVKILSGPFSESLREHYTNISTISYNSDSGVDLAFPCDTVVAGNNVTKCGLGISCEMLNPDGHPCGYLMAPRSSISNTPLMMANSIGIIDAGYRGELIVAFRNFDNNPYPIGKGTRLVQIIAPDLNPIHVEVVELLSESERGERGFGSTGLN